MTHFEQDVAGAQEMRRVLGPFARAILVRTSQGDFAVPVEDMHVGQELRQNGSYGAAELSTLRSLCHPGTRLLVAGAHIGSLVVPLAKICQSVVAIEANPQTFELLQFNIGLNGLKNCRVINKAAGNRAEQIEFVMNRANTGGSKRKPVVANPAYFYDNPEIVKVEAARLDDLLPGEVFDLILMDIEGSEYFALQGMQRILASAGALQVEFLPHHLRDVAAVSVADFVALISPHFSALCIVGKQLVVGREQFVTVLSEMFDRDEGDAGLIFLRNPPEQVQFRQMKPGEPGSAVNPEGPGRQGPLPA